MKTFMASPATIDRKWYVVDADGKTLGRLASEVAKVLRGKNKAIFTPHIDTGDYVIIVNAEKIKVTGKIIAYDSDGTLILDGTRIYKYHETKPTEMYFANLVSEFSCNYGFFAD